MTASSRSAVGQRQAPLRTRYRDHPEDAATSKWARTSSGVIEPGDPFHGEVEIGQGFGVRLNYGLDRHVGGDHDLPNPGDLLCAAVAACADGAIRMVADLLGVELDYLSVEVSGVVDVRGTLMVDRRVQVGFEGLACAVRLRPAPGTDPASVGRLLELAERSCVNMDTLRRGLDIDITSDVAFEE